MSKYREKSEVISCTVDDQRETLYECPPNCKARVPMIFLGNAGETVLITLEIYKASSTTRFSVITDKSFSATDFLQIADSYFVLEAGDRFEVTADGTTPSVTAVCTVEEEFINV